MSLSVPQRRRCLGAVLFAIVSTAAAAAPPTLGDTLYAAAARAPELASARALIDAARHDAARAGALPDPMLMLGVDNLPITGSMAGSLGADMMTMRRLGLSQDWPSRRKRDARRGLADAMVIEREAELLLAQRDLQRNAGAAWIELWRAQRTQALLLELQQETVRASQIVDARFRAGGSTGSDALVLRAQAATLQAQRISAEADVEAGRARLARWLQAEISGELAAPDVEQPPAALAQLQQSPSRAPSLRVADARIRRSEQAIAVAAAERRPDLRTTAAWGARSGRDDMLMFEVGIGLPIFPARRQARDVAARRAEHEAELMQREAELRDLQAELAAELARWRALREQSLRYRDELLPLAADRIALSLSAYRAGAELQPWIEAHHDLVELQLAEVEIRAALAQSWVVLATWLPEGVQ